MNVPEPRRVALIGLSGAGKTEAGRRLADALGWPFVDSDREVVKEAGRTVPEIFAAEGEEGFRKREARALSRLAQRPLPLVAALGGGAVLSPENRNLLKNSFYVVWIQVDPEEARRRLRGAGDRPLLGAGDPEAILRDLEARRLPLYSEAADARVISNEHSTPGAVGDALLRILAAAPGAVDEP